MISFGTYTQKNLSHLLLFCDKIRELTSTARERLFVSLKGGKKLPFPEEAPLKSFQ